MPALSAACEISDLEHVWRNRVLSGSYAQGFGLHSRVSGFYSQDFSFLASHSRGTQNDDKIYVFGEKNFGEKKPDFGHDGASQRILMFRAFKELNQKVRVCQLQQYWFSTIRSGTRKGGGAAVKIARVPGVRKSGQHGAAA